MLIRWPIWSWVTIVTLYKAVESQLCWEHEFIRSAYKVHTRITGFVLKIMWLPQRQFKSECLENIDVTATHLLFSIFGYLSLVSVYCRVRTEGSGTWTNTWVSSPGSAAADGSPGSGSSLWTGESWDGVSGGLITTDLSERLLSLLLPPLCLSRLRSLKTGKLTKITDTVTNSM